MGEFTVGDYTYRIARPMSAKLQIAIVAKVSPLLASGFGELVPLFLELKAEGFKNIAEVDIGRLAGMATPVAVQLSKMADEDREFIIFSCLATCDRIKIGEKGWAPIWSSSANTSMFDDINMDAFLMLRITLGVMQETFRNFLPASLSELIGGATRRAA